MPPHQGKPFLELFAAHSIRPDVTRMFVAARQQDYAAPRRPVELKPLILHSGMRIADG
jgi:hypothetical protein